MKFIADTNIVANCVVSLRTAGHDVNYVAERSADPGDLAILVEARNEGRILISKDTDIGTLVFRDGETHSGVLAGRRFGFGAERSATRPFGCG